MEEVFLTFRLISHTERNTDRYSIFSLHDHHEQIILPPNTEVTHSFKVLLVPGQHVLTLELGGKTNEDTYDVDGKMVSSSIELLEVRMFDLNITSIWMEEASFTPKNRWYYEQHIKEPSNYPIPVKRLFDSGWNGTYNFKIRSPVYVWALENT